MDSLASNDEQVVIGADAAEDRVVDPADFAVVNRREFFHEADEVHDALQRVANPKLEPRSCREACERVGTVWGQYQEQPGLLDPFLEGMVDPLMGAISGAVRSNPTAPQTVLPNLHMLSSLLYLLTTVRGYKTVSRFFPHEASDLEPCLEAAEAEAAAAQTDTWSTLYCLTLWLGMVLLTPFDLKSIDSGGVKGLSVRIHDLGLRGLRSASRNRDASAWMLAKYFMRPDVAAEGAMQTFLRWTKDLWSPGEGSVDGKPVSITALACVRSGSLQAWNQALKTAQRTVLKSVWVQVLELVLSGPTGAGDADFGTSSTLRKLRVAVACRAGLVALPPRLASWRYERGARSLLVNFSQATGDAASSANAGTVTAAPGCLAQGQTKPIQTRGSAAGTAEEDEDDDVPEQIDEVVDILLSSLSDADTVVRWAAAKGVGRITNRLSRDFGDQVLESLLDRCFSFRATDKAWHGGCLALAELTRRGLLLPERLPTVVPLVCQALHFEQVTGTHAVGQHVRDAACYVCWAFARAYAPEVLADFVADIASTLIQVAVYDREINCRRAAAAAVQEHVGRQGTFPDGIDVVTIADYWTLSSRRHAYLVVAPELANLGSYRRGLIDCLVDRKLQHQDVQVRLLACQALARLAEDPSEETAAYFNKTILPKLSARALDGLQVGGSTGSATAGQAPAAGNAAAGIVQLRHGAVAAVAALLRVLQEHISSENQNSIRNLVPSLEKARAYRGRGGEVIRHAACELLGSLAAAISWPFKDATCTRYLQTVDECARHTTESIQVAAVDALKSLVLRRFKPELCSKSVVSYLAALRKPDETISARRGSVLSLGVFPHAVLAEQISEVLAVLCQEVRGADLPGGKDHEDPQTRQYAVLSLGRVCLGNALDAEHLESLVSTLEAAMHDYAVDRRGDVGSWVREVAMEVIAALLSAQRCGALPTLTGTGSTTRLVALLLQQSVEKIDRLRDRAFWLLRRLAVNSPPAPEFSVELAYQRVCHGEQYDHLAPREAWSDRLTGPGECPPGLAWPPAHLGALTSALSKVPCAAMAAGRTQGDEVGVPEAPADAKAEHEDERSVAVFDAIAPMLTYEEYRGAILMGLVVSMGGITESTTKNAKKVLLQFLQEDGASATEGSSSETKEARRVKVCEGLLQIFTRVGTGDGDAEAKRLLIPLLNTIGILLAQDCFPQALAATLQERALDVVRSSRDIGRLRASTAVFVGLLRWPGGVRRRSLSVLLQLLGYSFPVVRQSTAQALYIRLLEEEGDLDLTGDVQEAPQSTPQLDSSQAGSEVLTPTPARAEPSPPGGVVAASVLGEVLELITVTPWGTDNEEVLVKALREVYSTLGFELPTSGRSLLAPKKGKTDRRQQPEYANLVHENHY
mmetsp:Transcript_122454/g.357517  ORF Transcript_122454/g.357517 Transcript_122454/m.357517 type:complete len:1379 (+) Transcript_122454:75-4211(+)